VQYSRVNDEGEAYREKAWESLAGAESETANGRYNNAANRAYYACYQAAIGALVSAGLRRSRWDHDYVQAQFSGQLIGRRKLYPSELRSVLSDLSILRVEADYEQKNVSRSSAHRAVREARRFLNRVLGSSDGQS
jgi:uncharacterized protein (UPF0332 family)